MAVQQKVQMKMQQPSMAVSKANQDRAMQVVENYLNASNKQVKANISKFSTLSAIWRLIRRNKEDPTDKFVLEALDRMGKDKMHSQVALQISEITMNRLQNLQKSSLFKMLPFLIGMLAVGVLVTLILFAKPIEFSNPLIQKYLIGLGIFVPVMIFGMGSRRQVKIDMTASNIVFQAASAYATAKMQGKGKVGALQNLNEMRRRAKRDEEKSKEKGDKKSKKSDKKSKKK